MKGSGLLYAALAGGGLLAIIAIALAVIGGDEEPGLLQPSAEITPPAAVAPSVQIKEKKDNRSDQSTLTVQAPPRPEPPQQQLQTTPETVVTPEPEIATRALNEPRPVSSPQQSDTAPEKAETQGEVASPEPVPRFDVVRVSPAGNMVIAGRAEPNAEVHILDKGESIGTTKADDRGEWVFLPSEKLAPGNRELTLSTLGPSGNQQESDRSVLIVMPKAVEVAEAAEMAETAEMALGDEAAAAPIIVSTPRAASETPEVQILQAPQTDPETPITVDVVEYDSEGQIGIAGRAEPETSVRIYVNDQPAGESATDNTGQWRIEPPHDLPPGLYRLRADQVAPTGEVVARVELPFVKEELAALPEPGQSYVVQPGNSLWRIARSSYGSGLQYIVIYQSNQSQIRDPDLIYPGQVFDIPRSGF